MNTDLFEIPEFLQRTDTAKGPASLKFNTKRVWVTTSEAREIREQEEAEAPVIETKEISTEARNTLMAWAFASDIEDVIFGSVEGTAEPTDVIQLIKLAGLKPKIIRLIESRVEDLVKEIQLIDEEEDITENYSFLNDADIKKLKAVSVEVLRHVHNQITGKKAEASQNARKSRRVEKATAGVKFQAEFNELGLTSLDPSKVLGMDRVVVYDTKRRQIGIYVAQDGKKLEFKGTTIQNYDADKSFVKRLRNPKEDVPLFVDATKSRIDSLLAEINSKAQTVNGRTRNEVMFLQVFE